MALALFTEKLIILGATDSLPRYSLLKETTLTGDLTHFSVYSKYSFAVNFWLHIVQVVKDIGYLLSHFLQYMCDIGLGYEDTKITTIQVIWIFLRGYHILLLRKTYEFSNFEHFPPISLDQVSITVFWG